MKRLLCSLFCLMLALFLLAGCGKAAGPAAPGTNPSSVAGTALPAGQPAEAAAADPLVGSGASAASGAAETAISEPGGTAMTTIQIIVGEAAFSARLYDNEAARALAQMLPLTLEMNELNGNEKYYYLGEALPGSPGTPGAVCAGDLMLYGTDCLVLFYKDFSTAYSYTPLGRIADPQGLAAALGDKSVQVTFQA